jgi:hypothetical protein
VDHAKITTAIIDNVPHDSSPYVWWCLV